MHVHVGMCLCVQSSAYIGVITRLQCAITLYPPCARFDTLAQKNPDSKSAERKKLRSPMSTLLLSDDAGHRHLNRKQTANAHLVGFVSNVLCHKAERRMPSKTVGRDINPYVTAIRIGTVLSGALGCTGQLGPNARETIPGLCTQKCTL